MNSIEVRVSVPDLLPQPVDRMHRGEQVAQALEALARGVRQLGAGNGEIHAIRSENSMLLGAACISITNTEKPNGTAVGNS